MYIFRIQNDNGVGCMLCPPHLYKMPYELKYDYSDIIKDKNGIETDRLQHPDCDFGTPLAEAYYKKLIYRGSPYVFGFATIKDLYTWFCPATVGGFEANGYSIYVYDIPEEHILRGSRQVAFNPIHSNNTIKISHKDLRRKFRNISV